MTENRLLTPQEYAKHLKDYCHLKDDEVEIVLNNVYKRIKQEKQLENFNAKGNRNKAFRKE